MKVFPLLEFNCAICGTELVQDDDNHAALIHPSEVDDGDGIFFSKMVRVECLNAGKRVERPSAELNDLGGIFAELRGLN